MRLVRLSASDDSVFSPVTFNEGLSVILAEIRLPQNKGLDTHNLGKSTVAALVDYCLLRGASGFFLYDHPQKFAPLTFYLDVAVAPDVYITIARTSAHSKIDIDIRHDSWTGEAADRIWTHTGLSLASAKRILDGTLDFRALGRWTYRDITSYLLRSQGDYGDVFHLKKFRGVHRDWKPFLAPLLGLDADQVSELYDVEEAKKNIDSKVGSLTKVVGTVDADLSVLNGLIDIRRREANQKRSELEAFNLLPAEHAAMKTLIEEVEVELGSLTERQYYLTKEIERIRLALEGERIHFDPKSAEDLFGAAGIAFPKDVKRSFDQLISFNRALTMEREAQLRERLAELEVESRDLPSAIAEKNQERTSHLSLLRDTDSLAKYKRLNAELVKVEADLVALESRRVILEQVRDLRHESRVLGAVISKLQGGVEEDLISKSGDSESLYSKIGQYFDEIVFEVVSQHALLSVKTNRAGHLEFQATILSPEGISTSAGRGASYSKLLCIAFDLAVLRGYLGTKFPRFVVHDGVFEALDPRKKENLLRVYRRYASLGLQPVISTIDEDLSRPVGPEADAVQESDVVALLHDENDSGRLFKFGAY